MTNTQIISCASLKAEYAAIDSRIPHLEPEIQASLMGRIDQLNTEEKADLHLAAHYALKGQSPIVLALLSVEHPMRDLFTSAGAPEDVRAVQYIKNVFTKQLLQQEISRLDVCEI